MENFKDVFESNPNADKLFVVDGMPFLDEVQAKNYAGEKPVRVVSRFVTEAIEQIRDDLKEKGKKKLTGEANPGGEAPVDTKEPVDPKEPDPA